MGTTSMILKTDSRGRVRTPPERREALLAEFERSGLSATMFSAMVGVRYQTFATWVQQRKGARRRVGRLRGSPSVRFAEVVPHGAQGVSRGAALRIVLPGGAAFDLRERSQVELAAQLLKTLGSSTPCRVSRVA
jgi:hypothetical protein